MNERCEIKRRFNSEVQQRCIYDMAEHRGWRKGRGQGRILLPLAARIETITYDNGKEFASHAAIVAALGAKSYFAKPYHSWECGLNEHTNGLVRQYFPKGIDFSTLSNADVQRVEDKLNSRPRKILGYKPQARVS
jgi:IS30 family transposase